MTWARYQDSFVKLTFYPAYMEFQLFDDEYLFDDITLYRYCIFRYNVYSLRSFSYEWNGLILICKHTTRLKMGVDQNHYCNLFWRITNALICTTKIGKGRLAFLFAYSIFLKKLHNRVCNTKYEDGSRHNTN